MSKFIIILAFFAVVFSISPEMEDLKEFQIFNIKFNKEYPTIREFIRRFEIFKKNLHKYKSSELYNEGIIIKYFDLSEEEVQRVYPALDLTSIRSLNFSFVNPEDLKDVKAPDHFDWIADRHVLGAAKNQGSCNSCWAFSTVANIEALYFIKYKQRRRFSEQQLVDCNIDNHKCDGEGYMLNTFEWIKKNGGLQLEDDYKYIGEFQGCRENPNKLAVKISDYMMLNTTDEEVIKKFLYNTGPLVAAFNMAYLSDYSGEIIDIDDIECPHKVRKDMNHAVLIVGYGSENGKDFWNVRNSWGDKFGENGNFKIARGKGTCGINLFITSAVIE